MSYPKRIQHMPSYPQPPLYGGTYSTPPPLSQQFSGSLKSRAPLSLTSPFKLDLNVVLEEAKMSKFIRLNDFSFGDEGAEKIASFLDVHKHIEVLELRGNNITSEGFALICEGLKSNQNIKVIKMEGNVIGSGFRGLEALNYILSQNNSIELIDLKANKINPSLMTLIVNLIKNGRNLLVLDLRYNELENSTGQAILSALDMNEVIQNIELAGNNISEELIFGINNRLEPRRIGSRKFPEQSALMPPMYQRDPVRSRPLGNDFRYPLMELRVPPPDQLQQQQQIDREIHEIIGPNQGSLGHGGAFDKKFEIENRRNIELIDKYMRELEEERRFRKDFEAKYIKARENESKAIEDMKLKLDHLVEENKVIKEDNKALQKENSILMDRLENYDNVHNIDLETIKALESHIQDKENELLKKEELHKINIEKFIKENNMIILDYEKRTDIKLKDLMKENELYHKKNVDLENQIKNLKEDIKNIEYFKHEELKDVYAKSRDEEKSKQLVHLKKLESDIRKLDDENLRLKREYDNDLNEYKQLEKRLKDKLVFYDDESKRLKNEINANLEHYNKEKIKNETLTNEILMRDGTIGKLESEIRDLQKSLSTKENLYKENIDKLTREIEDDRIVYEENKINLQNRISDLDKQLRQAQSEYNKLKQELGKLSEMLISNLTQSVYRTFTEFRNMNQPQG